MPPARPGNRPRLMGLVMLTFFRTWSRWIIDWLGSTDLLLLVSLLVLVTGLWGFFQLAEAVRAGETQRLDERILLALRDPSNPAVPIGPAWAGEVGRDLTALGGIAFLVLITASVAGFLLLCRKYHALALLLLAIGGGLLLSTLLKGSFDRPRPSVVPHLSYVSTSSFPSGHSMLSAVVYLTLGSFLARLVQPMRLKLYLLAVALVLTILVGCSRVYLGVHYPTDVLAGWAAGLAWAVLCWLLARYLQHRGAVEKEM
jgi:undecaprenyl-diphosphatase